MKKEIFVIFILTVFGFSETLFEVKDSSNHSVLDVSTDGIRIMNYPDTLMIISSSEIRANISNSKGLSRTFSVTTPASVKGFKNVMKVTADSTRFWINESGSGFGVASNSGLKTVNTNVFEVTTENARLRESGGGDEYMHFSPQNIFLGLRAGLLTTPGVINDVEVGKNNLFIGNEAGFNHTTGMNNIFIGNTSGYITNYGSRNIFMGVNAGYNNKTGDDNVYIGTEAGKGYQSGSIFSNGNNNVFIGGKSGFNIKWGFQNVALGYWSGYYNETGNYNVFLGALAGVNNVTGINNVYVGYGSGAFNTGNNNVFLGRNGNLDNTSIDGCVFLGNDAGTPETTSNKLYIDNSNTANPLIYGDFSNDIIKVNGKLGVGLSPTYKIHSLDETVSNDNPAIYGKHNVMDSYGVGVRGEGGYRGVIGYASATSFECRGVYGIATGTGTGLRYGIYGEASGGATNWAGYFSGNVHATQFLTTGKVEVKIDHPLDPKNKILTHSTVISDQMTSIYNGIIILDSDGHAEVKLPEWFESLNTDFRYQLTPIGASGPDLYISKEIENNNFEISGGKPGMKVSWQVTAARNDNYARQNSIEVESEKSDIETGYYLNPESFGEPEEMGIDYQNVKNARKD